MSTLSPAIPAIETFGLDRLPSSMPDDLSDVALEARLFPASTAVHR
jgi:hypothetical protein